MTNLIQTSRSFFRRWANVAGVAAVLAMIPVTSHSALTQFAYDFSFVGFGSYFGNPVPVDPVTGSVKVTLDIGASSQEGVVDSFTLNGPTQAFGTSGVRFLLQDSPYFSGGVRYHLYSLFLGKIVPKPPGGISPDSIGNVYFGTDDFYMDINNIDYLGAGSMMIYTNSATDDAWFTRNSTVTVGSIAPTDGTVPEPGSFVLLSLGLLGIGAARASRLTSR